MAPPIDLSLPTALILIDNQSAFTHPSTVSLWGASRSNPHYEANLQSLLSTFRDARATSSTPLEVIHVFHSSDSFSSPLHPSHPAGGIRPLDFAIPAADGSEPIFWKNVNSSFIGTGLESHLRQKGIRQIICAGLTTDHCVSTTVRMAANLGVVDRFLDDGPVRFRADGSRENEVRVEKGRIILVSDATATFSKGDFDADTVHKVSVASLDGEFADVIGTEEVVEALKGIKKH
jgi:nicotinamidase-related amidase